MEKITIKGTDIIFDDIEDGKGKIIVSNWRFNFSYYWGAMGKNTDLKKFVTEINEEYFANALAGGFDGVFNAKLTFRNVRKFIKEEFRYELPWYKHMEFQKQMRKELMSWQRSCETEYQFVNDWPSFWRYTVDYYLIQDWIEQNEIESIFNGICEHWNFIEKDRSNEYYFCIQLHRDLVRYLNKAK